LPGTSLFEDRGVYCRVVPACGKDGLGADKRSADCAAFVSGSAKAAQQWELERRFEVFEASLLS
jgi:adenosine deaminase